MKVIHVLGTGCESCSQLKENVRAAIATLPDEYEILEVRDIEEIVDLAKADRIQLIEEIANLFEPTVQAFMTSDKEIGQKGLVEGQILAKRCDAVIDDLDWDLTSRTDGSTVRSVPARDLWRQISEAAWACADPGLQFDTIINEWHTCPEGGRIRGSNPCSEYMFLDNTACNLASLNLRKFQKEGGSIDIEALRHAVALLILAQEILVDHTDYPTPAITRNSHLYRSLGLGYANLGAVIMRLGLPYASKEARAWAGEDPFVTGNVYETVVVKPFKKVMPA